MTTMHQTRILLRFFIGYLLLHFLIASIFVFVVTGISRNRMIRETQNEMRSIALLLHNHIFDLPAGINDPNLVSFLKRLGPETQFRYTIIDADGKVLVDSEKGEQDIGPHGNRPEIMQAAETGLGVAERFSTTVEKPMIYLAIPYVQNESIDSVVEGGKARKDYQGFIRVATPTQAINNSTIEIQGWLWLSSLILAVVAIVLMGVFTTSGLRPLNQFADTARQIGLGQYETTIPLRSRTGEWGVLADALTQMKLELANRESRLLENNQRMQAVWSSMIEGVLSTSSDGNVSMANDAACKMLSVSQAEIIEKNLLDMVRYPELRQAIEKARENREIGQAEFETTDEPRRRIKARVSILPNDPGEVAVVLHDITELRALENMRRDFVANVSHELKTPLAAIKAYSETLRLGALHDQEKNLAFVEQIETQAELLNLQIQDLIELARIESGNAAADIKPTSINDVCRNCIELVEANAAQENIHVSFETKLEELFALADENGVATIVTNLLSNAIHYTPEGGQVIIRTERESDFVVIEVVDTGIGISEEEQARVFERFYRVDKARSRDKGGTGLGLSIVKHLSQSFGGSVTLESQPGKGSTFRIELPAAGVNQSA